MEIKGQVIKIMEPVTGTSSRGDWKKQEIVIQQPGEHGKQLCLSLWGDKVPVPALNKDITASVDFESRESNGRYYTECRCWKID